MFLVEFGDGRFVDLKKLDYVGINKGVVTFTLSGDVSEIAFIVMPDYVGTFINNLQALNNGLSDVSLRYKELTEGKVIG